MIATLFLLLTVYAPFAGAAYCSGAPAPGERTNDFPIFDEDLRFIKSVPNAKLYEAGPSNATFPVVHLWGNAYEVGYAQGLIRKQEIKEFVYKTMGYLESAAFMEMDGDKLPDWAKIMIINSGVDAALDWTRRVTEPFTPQDYFDEIKGIADASGVSYDLLYWLNMFPELTKAQCSFFGAWDTAVSKAGHAYQLRALDFDTDGPFKDFPQVTVYHPSTGNAYAQVGWPGSIGVLTGFSSQQLAISEIGVSFPDDSFGQGTYPNTPPEKVKGEPWMFIMRDVLQFESSLDGAKSRISNANRTCNLIIGLGDGKAGKSNGCQFSGYVANFYDDTNLLPVNETWHVPVEDVVYNGMDWLCPGFNQVLGSQLQKYHGAIDEVVTIKNILPTTQTGNLHIAVMDLTEQTMHVSFCRGEKADPSEPHYAYERQFTRLNMKEMFAEQAPALDHVKKSQ